MAAKLQQQSAENALLLLMKQQVEKTSQKSTPHLRSQSEKFLQILIA